jgi:hypothetical protein
LRGAQFSRGACILAARKKARHSHGASLLKTIRLVHFYLGVFFAPLIVFFAFSGSLQVFKLHERYRAVPGASADWVAWMAQVHKEQEWAAPRAAPPKRAAPDAPGAAPKKAEETPPTPIKVLAGLMGLALAATTLLGLWIGFNYPRRRVGFSVALALGLALPIAFLAF